MADDDWLYGPSNAVGGAAVAPPSPPPVTQQVSQPAPSSNDDWLYGPSKATNAPVGDTSFSPETNLAPGDVGKALSYGYHAGLVAPIEEARGALPGGEDWVTSAKTEREKGEAARASLSPGAEKTWTVYGAEQAPALVGMAAPALVAGTVGAPAVLTAGLAIGAGALIQGGSGISEVKSAIESANDDDLQQANPTYAGYRQTMPEADAKAKLGADFAPYVGVPSAVIGGTLGAVGGAEVGNLAEKLGVDAAVRSALTGVGKTQGLVTGAGRGLIEAGVPGAAQTAVTGHVTSEATGAEEPSFKEDITSGVGQGLFGAAIGGPMGLIHAPSKIIPKSTPRDLRQTPGEATVAREPAQVTYQKPKEPAVAPNDVAADPAPQSPTAANKGVDPGVSAAINDQPLPPKDPRVTQGVTETPYVHPTVPIGEAEPNRPSGDQRSRWTIKAQPEGLFEGGQTLELNKGRPVAEGITQEENVVPPPVAQPTPPPSETAREAPPAGDTTGVGATPQTAQEVRPAPVSAPPVEDTAANQPETRAELEAQHADLMNRASPRDNIIYPKGMQPFDITQEKWRYGKVKLPEPDGRWVQFDHSNPARSLTKPKIKDFAANNKLNELEQFGPVNKDEAVSRIAAGEPGAVVTERNPDGTEVKGAVGTTATVPDQVAAMEASKTPGHTVGVEDIAANHAQRQAEVAQEHTVQPEVVAPNPVGNAEAEKAARLEALKQEMNAKLAAGVTTDELTRPKEAVPADAIRMDPALQAARDAQAQRRILRPETPEEKAAQEAQRVAQDRAATTKTEPSKAQARAEKAPEDIKPGNKSTAQKDAMKEANRIASEVVARHPPKDIEALAIDPSEKGGKGSRTALHARAKAMVADAEKAGYEFKGRAMHRADPETRHNNDALTLYEAKLLAGKKVLKTEDITRFLKNEHDLKTGGEEAYKRVLGERSQTGKETAAERGKQTGEAQGVEDIDEAAKPAAGSIEKPDVAEEYEAAKERVAEEDVAREPGEARQETPLQRQAREASERARAKLEAQERAAAERGPAGKVRPSEGEGRAETNLQGKTPTKAPVVEVRKTRAIKRSMEDGEEPERYGRARTIMIQDEHGNPMGITPRRTSTGAEAIDEHYDPKAYDKEQQQLNEHLIEGLKKYAGDIPVHYLSQDEIDHTFGKGTKGLFYRDDTGAQHIFLAEGADQQTAIHEVLHAATAKAFDSSPEFRELLAQLHKEVRNSDDFINMSAADKYMISYPVSDPEEFLVGMMTNPKVQRLLKQVKISPELARAIGIPKWRKMTGWHAALHMIQKALGLSVRDVSAIEAAMSISQQAMWMHPRAGGDLMEAMARGDRAREAEQIKPAVSLPRLRFSREDPPEEQAKGMGEDAQNAVQKPSSFWDNDRVQATKSGIGEKLKQGYVKGAMTDVLRIDNEHLFGEKTEANPMRRAQEGLLKQGHMIENILKGHTDLLQRAMDMKRLNPDGLDRMYSLLSEAHDFNVHPDVELGEGLNDYIKANPKTGEYDETTNKDYHEAIHAHPRLSDDFNHSIPEEQRFFKDVRDVLMQEGAKSVKANIETLTQGVKTDFERDEKLQDALKTPEANRTPSEIKRVQRYEAITKAINGEKLAEGDEHDTYIDNPHVKALRDLRGMLKQEGPHFPGTRKGGWVVNAEHELPKAPNAIEMKDNAVTFGSEKEAYDYQKELVSKSLPSHIEKVSEPVSSEQQPGQGGDQYKVTVQNKHSSATNDIYEGRKLSAKLKEMGLKNVTEPMLRERNESIDYGLHSGTLRAMDHAVDALTHLTEDEKTTLKEANEQAALGLMKGNRMNRGLLKSNRVRGANADPVLALHDYIANSARSQARSKTMPDIDKAFAEMRDIARDKQDANTPMRGMLVREMEDRTGAFGKDGFTGQMSKPLQAITTLAYLKDMMAPVHFALDLLHPYQYSIPHMAGRFGFGAAHGTYAKTLGDMGAGGTLGRGMKGMFSALKGSDHRATDLMTGIRDSLAKNGATADELRAFDVARETPHLGSIVTDFSKSFDRTGPLSRANYYLQGIGNEMSHAVDAVNRVGTYMSAYRLERQKMGKAETLEQNAAHHAQAVRFAKDTVSQTQGLYSASNRASFMRNPIVRAAMQFRTLPMMVYRLIGKNLYLAFKGETKEVKQAAIISLVSTMGTTAALAGAAAGVPEPIRLAVELSHAFGLPSWQDYEDDARRYTDTHMGKFGSRLLMDGILGSVGLDARNRIGLQDLMVKEQALQSPKDFMFDMMGSGAGYINDEASGMHQVMKGDWRHAIPNLMPIRIFSDAAKAIMENEGGKQGGHGQVDMKPLDPFETFWKAAGGMPLREALYNKESNLIREESSDRKDAIAAGAGGNTAAVKKWNLAHPTNRITTTHVLKAKNKPMTHRERENAEKYSAYQ